MDTLLAQNQILPCIIARLNHDQSIDTDERIGIKFLRHRPTLNPTSNFVIHCHNENYHKNIPF